jgi:hypothetical protein
MRSPEQQEVALRCVGLANGNIEQAQRIYAFVTGADEQTARDLLEHINAITSRS